MTEQVAALLGQEGSAERMLIITGRVLCLLAVLWMAWAVSGMAWLASGHDGSRLSGVAPSVSVRSVPTAVDLMKLSSLNLFGQASVLPSGVAAENAPDTSLQLRLAGVFVSTDPNRSSAIVAEQSQPTGKLYRLNESLPGGATLESVFEDRILIRRGAGNPEVLRFEKTDLLDGAPSSSPASTLMVGGVPSVRALLGSAADAMHRSSSDFLKEMGLRASGSGYEVSSDTPEQIRAGAGLQPGDKILSVNGQQLGNLQADMQILESLKNGGTARVEIQRGAQIVTIERKF